MPSLSLTDAPESRGESATCRTPYSAFLAPPERDREKPRGPYCSYVSALERERERGGVIYERLTVVWISIAIIYTLQLCEYGRVYKNSVFTDCSVISLSIHILWERAKFAYFPALFLRVSRSTAQHSRIRAAISSLSLCRPVIDCPVNSRPRASSEAQQK